MIISRTPFRISFFGGGTDYPAWYRKHGGAVLATTIDKYCYLTVRYLPPFHEHRHRIVYRKIEICSQVDEIQHPAVRAVLQHLGIKRGLEIHHDGDLPARSGMGSSSAFTVGLLHAMYALYGKIVSKHQLAMESIYLEQEVLKEVVGSQDQVLAAHGGLNRIIFMPNGNISVRPLTISRSRIEELNSHLMLFYTGIKRTAAKVARSYVDNIDQKKQQFLLLKAFVEEAISILVGDQDISAFGKLLHEAWQVKQGLSNKVSNPHVDRIYQTARKAGAVGGKLTGAGGGGFMLLFAPPASHKRVREALHDLIYVPVQFDFDGSRIIFFDLDKDYEKLDLIRANRQLRPFEEHRSILTKEESS